MKLLLILPLLLVLTIIAPTAYAQIQSSMVVTTDKLIYQSGDTILVSGNVENKIVGMPVILQLFTEGVAIDNTKVTVAEDGTFSRTILVHGGLWEKSGDYIFRVTHGTENTETKFTLQVIETSDSISVQPINVTTNKSIYQSWDIITISGSVQTLEEYSQSVTMVVVDPNGNIVTIAQVIPNSDGSFSHVIDDSKIIIEGEYEVRAQYGSLKITSNFDFISNGVFSEPLCGAGTVFDEGSNSCVLGSPKIISENESIVELQNQIVELKLENRELKQEITSLNHEMSQLKDLLINGLKEIYNWMS